METDGTVQEYHALSLRYLAAAQGNLAQGLHEPALANGLHALELGIKALLHLKIEGPIKTHNVGGLLGRHYQAELGKLACRTVNRILLSYNLPRYPGTGAPREEDVRVDLEFIGELVGKSFGEIIRAKIGP